MPIIVHDMKVIRELEIKNKDEVVVIKFKQLTYAERSKILTLTTKTEQGKVLLDYTRSCFLYLKYSLREVLGIVDEEGKEYKLVFEAETDYVTDYCIEQLLGSNITDELMYVADNLGNKGYLNEIVDPITKIPVKNISIVTNKKQLKKK